MDSIKTARILRKIIEKTIKIIKLVSWVIDIEIERF
jgi:hypothetical protein